MDPGFRRDAMLCSSLMRSGVTAIESDPAGDCFAPLAMTETAAAEREAGHGDVSRRGAGRPAVVLGDADPRDGEGARRILAGPRVAAGAADADDRGREALSRHHAGGGGGCNGPQARQLLS